MIEKVYNLLGLRKTTILFLTRIGNKISSETIMRELTPELEEQCEDDNLSYIHINDKLSINKNNIVVFGELDLNDERDINAIKEYCYIPEDYDAHVLSNFNYEKGIYTTIEGIAKSYITYNPILWFKYNHCLIGKPKKILIYKRYAHC